MSDKAATLIADKTDYCSANQSTGDIENPVPSSSQLPGEWCKVGSIWGLFNERTGHDGDVCNFTRQNLFHGRFLK